MTFAVGSPEQVRLFSMLCSCLKLCGQVKTVDSAAANAASQGFWQIALGAVNALTLSAQHHTAAAVAPAAAALATAMESLPWLVLVGCCCLLWASELQQLQDSRPQLGQQLLRLQAGTSVAAALGVSPQHSIVWLLQQAEASVTVGILQQCRQWLQQGDRAAVLAAAGYPADAAVQQLQVTITALEALAAATKAESATMAYSFLAGSLQTLGVVLNTLAVPHTCNSPACSSMAGPTELATVSGRRCVCVLAA